VVAGAAPAGGLLELTGGEAAVSAIRRHPRRPTLLVRLWNPSDAPTSETLRLTLPVAAAWLCDLLEERQEDLPLGAAPTTEVLVPLLPHRIVTVELELAGGEDAA
jgi:alpha-mannosidase